MEEAQPLLQARVPDPGPTPILRLGLSSVLDLQRCYLPFLRNGGLFLRTTTGFTPGASVILLLRLPRTENIAVVSASVAWITPADNPDRLAQGVGFHFNERENGATSQIETLLATEAGIPESGYTL